MDNSGMAFEAARILTRKDGAAVQSRQIGGVRVTDLRLTAKAAKTIGKRAGRYITLRGEPSSPGMSGLLKRALEQMLPPRGTLFAAGLGNPDITQDSLGAACVRLTRAHKGARYSLAAMETDVAAKTGLETAKLVRAAARELHADCVIAVDALSCQDPRCIGETVQITDAGIIPGSGAGADGAELRGEVLDCPLIAVGVPTVTPLSELTREPADKAFLVSTSDIDTIINIWAEIIGGALDSLAD